MIAEWSYEVAVRTALIELERGDWAEDGDGSMDFGRGVRFACDLIHERVAEARLEFTVVDPAIFDELLAEYEKDVADEPAE